VTNQVKSRKPDGDRELRKLRRFAGARFGGEASKKFQARKASLRHSHRSERWRHCNAARAPDEQAGRSLLGRFEQTGRQEAYNPLFESVSRGHPGNNP